MTTCIICRYDVPMDDAIAPSASGRCVCLRCFTRETSTTMRMPKGLIRQLTELMEDVPAS